MSSDWPLSFSVPWPLSSDVPSSSVPKEFHKFTSMPRVTWNCLTGVDYVPYYSATAPPIMRTLYRCFMPYAIFTPWNSLSWQRSAFHRSALCPPSFLPIAFAELLNYLRTSPSPVCEMCSPDPDVFYLAQLAAIVLLLNRAFSFIVKTTRQLRNLLKSDTTIKKKLELPLTAKSILKLLQIQLEWSSPLPAAKLKPWSHETNPMDICCLNYTSSPSRPLLFQ